MISVYIHIPFCESICTYCDFCKLLKNDKWIDDYLIALKKEVESNYKGEKLKTLYIGGGTPSSLSIKQLEKLFDILKVFKLSKNAEITFESNAHDLTLEKLEFLKDKINRLSIGVQTFNNELIKVLGRKEADINNIILAKKYFDNINIDLMYGFNEENIDILKKDLETILKLDIPHISTYSLILEKHTRLYIEGYKILNENTCYEEIINNVLKKYGYNHYEISNYAKKGYESRHNQVYWNNQNYYGFGLGASGYIGNIRYDNTKSLNKYLRGEYLFSSHKLDLEETLENEFILGFRKIKGINKNDFYQKYHFNVSDIPLIKELIKQKLIIQDKKNIFINPKYLYLSNEILIKFINTNLLEH